MRDFRLKTFLLTKKSEIKIENSGDRDGGFTVCAQTAEELKTKHNIIASRIKVIGNTGEDIMRHDLFIEPDLT